MLDTQLLALILGLDFAVDACFLPLHVEVDSLETSNLVNAKEEIWATMSLLSSISYIIHQARINYTEE